MEERKPRNTQNIWKISIFLIPPKLDLITLIKLLLCLNLKNNNFSKLKKQA